MIPFNPIHADPGPVDGALFNRVQDRITSAFAHAVTVRDLAALTFDIVPYRPSDVTMRDSGVLQQTYDGVTATPLVTNVGAMHVLYGALAGTGLAEATANVLVDTTSATNPRLIVATTAVAAGSTNSSFFAYDDGTGGSVFAGTFMSHKNGASSGLIPQFNTRRGRGTIASPSAVSSNDSGQADLLAQVAFTGGYSGSSYVRGLGFFSWVQFNSTVDATHVPSVMAVCNDLSTNTTGGATMLINGITQAWTTSGDIVLGWYARAATDTLGYVYMQRTVSGPPTGAPVFPQRSAGGNCEAVPMIFEGGGSKLWAYLGGTWKSTTFV